METAVITGIAVACCVGLPAAIAVIYWWRGGKK